MVVWIMFEYATNDRVAKYRDFWSAPEILKRLMV